MANYLTDKYSNLEKRFLSIAGLQSLETTDSAFFRQSVNRRIRTAYERYPWPDFTVIGEAVTLNQDGTTDDDNIVRTYGVYVPGSGTTLACLNDDADVVFRVHKQNPTVTRYPDEYTFVSMLDYRVGSAGYPCIEIVNAGDELGTGSPATVYVTYRKALSTIIKEPKVLSGSTGGGDLVWGYEYDSGFFGDPTVNSGDNENIPYVFFEYAAFGAYADFLRGDGQTEKAQVEEQNAEMILRSEIDKVRNQSRQFRHDILQYRPSTQFRRHNVQAGGQSITQVELDNNVQ